MCYMEAIGVRELRQNLSVYLDRIKGGETFRVTEHGREVALLTPLPAKAMNVFERLVAEGKAIALTSPLKSLAAEAWTAGFRAVRTSWSCAKNACEKRISMRRPS